MEHFEHTQYVKVSYTEMLEAINPRLKLDLINPVITCPQSTNIDDLIFIALEIANMINRIDKKCKSKFRDLTIDNEKAQVILFYENIPIFRITICSNPSTVDIEKLDVIGTILVGEVVISIGNTIINRFIINDNYRKLTIFMMLFYDSQKC